MLDDADYFLSAANPTANVDQRDMEAMAIEVFHMPIVVKARQQAAARWKTILGSRTLSAEAKARFDDYVDEYAFRYVLQAVNSDANYPKVMAHVSGPPHEWFGMQVPGSRAGGGDCPDNNYSLIPVDAYARYELRGKRVEPGPADAPFTLTGNVSLSMTLASLEWEDVKLEPDGSFVVTLGPEPADGRANHIQSKPEARYLFLRDNRSDWHQIPIRYRVRRLDPPLGPPLTVEQIAERAAHFMANDVPTMYWFIYNPFLIIDYNSVMEPFNTGVIGGLVSQTISFARLKLAEDEAFVVTAGSAAAPFRGIVLHDFWLRSLDPGNRSSSMNNSQAIANADGSTTYVVSLRDPGVHNWIDPVGYTEPLVIHRWQGLSRTPGAEGLPWIKGELVKLSELDNVLPRETRRITPSERQRQLAERAESFGLRYVDH